MRVDNANNLPDERLSAIVGAAMRPSTVGQLLDWGREEPGLFQSAGVLSDVIVQDEFTHDVVVNLTNGLALVYEST